MISNYRKIEHLKPFLRRMMEGNVLRSANQMDRNV